MQKKFISVTLILQFTFSIENNSIQPTLYLQEIFQVVTNNLNEPEEKIEETITKKYIHPGGDYENPGYENPMDSQFTKRIGQIYLYLEQLIFILQWHLIVSIKKFLLPYSFIIYHLTKFKRLTFIFYQGLSDNHKKVLSNLLLTRSFFRYES
jgi:hypothetical protein